MLRVFLISALLLMLSCQAQESKKAIVKHEDWAISWGSAQNDVPSGVAIDSTENIYVCGVTLGALVSENKGQFDIYLTKINPAGKTLWIKQWGTSERETPNCIAIDKSGNIYIAGETKANLDSNKNQGGYDIFLSKIDSSGNRIWTKLWGTELDDNAYAIAFDKDENIYLTGYASSFNHNMNDKNANSLLLKINQQGKVLWNKQWGIEASTWAYDIAVSNSGQIYVCGWTQGEMEKGKKQAYDDIFLSKLDTSGSLLWTRQWGTIGNDEANALAIDEAENIYVTGRTGESLDGNMRKGRDDIFLSKFNASGEKSWTKLWGTHYDEKGKALVCAGNSIYVLGDTDGKMKGAKKVSRMDLFLTKLDTSGKILGTKQWGRKGISIAHSMAVYKSKYIVIAADYSNNESRNAILLKWDL